MSITNIRAGASARGALLYQVYGLGKLGTERRNAGEHRAVGFISDYGSDPTKAVWAHIRDAERVGRSSARRSEAFTLIHSFPKEEMNPENPEDIQKVGELGYELAKRLYPNSAVSVVVHNDSRGQNLHSHITVTNEDMVTGRAIRSNKLHKQVARVNDELMKEHGLSVTEPQADRTNQFMYWTGVRLAQINHQLEEEELTIPQRKKLIRAQEKHEQALQWEESIRESVSDALSSGSVTDFESFKEAMADIGVSVRFKERRGEVSAVTYGFTTEEGKTKAFRGKMLGPQYTAEGLKEIFEATKKYQEVHNARCEAEISREDARREHKALTDAGKEARQTKIDGERILHQQLEELNDGGSSTNTGIKRFADRRKSDYDKAKRASDESARASRSPQPSLQPRRAETRQTTYGTRRFSTYQPARTPEPDKDYGPEF